MPSTRYELLTLSVTQYGAITTTYIRILQRSNDFSNSQRSERPGAFDASAIFSNDALPFEGVVRRLVPNARDADCRICADRYVGHIDELSANDKNWSAAATNRIRPALDGEPRILLVMDSPHRDEYSRSCDYTPWPANGATGKKIRAHVHLIVPEGWLHHRTQVVLINAIPYQCSLGLIKSPYRDVVFRELWHHAGGRAFFQRRLLHWFRGDSLVVNACTAGRGQPSLREDVENAIAELLPHARRLRLCHPFGWMDPEKVTAVW